MSGKKFIVFEGTEGAGKTTLLNLLCDYLTNTEKVYTRFREPGTGVIGTAIRRILLDIEESPTLSDTTQLLLFAAAYRHTLLKTVLPALEREEYVVSDRTNISSKVYQADSEHIGMLTELNDSLCLPDVVFIMVVDYETMQERVGKRTGYSNYRDDPLESFHNTLRQRYLDFAKKTPYAVILDATKTADELLRDVLKHLDLI